METKQIWIYDDEVVIGPLGSIVTWDDTSINVYEQLKQVGVSLVLKATPFQIIIPRDVWNAIQIWAETVYGGLELNEYLNRMFVDKKLI